MRFGFAEGRTVGPAPAARRLPPRIGTAKLALSPTQAGQPLSPPQGSPRAGAQRGRRSGPEGGLAVTELLGRGGGSSGSLSCPGRSKGAAMSTWLWVLIIVVVVVLVFGVIRRRRS